MKLPHRVAADQSEQPEDQQDHRDRKEHRSPPADLYSTSYAAGKPLYLASSKLDNSGKYVTDYQRYGGRG